MKPIGPKYRAIASVPAGPLAKHGRRRFDAVELWGPEEADLYMGVAVGDDDYYGAVLDRAGSLALARSIVELWGFTAEDFMWRGGAS